MASDVMRTGRRSLVVLHITAPAPFGGLERVVAALAGGHRARGHEVHVAAVAESADDAAAFLEPLADQGVQGHPILVPPRAYRRERDALKALCRSIGPALVHTHGYRADVVSVGAARALRIPTISTVHGFTGGGWRNRLYERLQQLALRRFDAVVPVSQPLATLLQSRGVPPSRMRVIPNAWSSPGEPLSRDDARARLGITSGEVRIGWIGRLTAEKGADVLLDAVPHLSPELCVSFVGDGADRPALEARARRFGVEARVTWHGPVPNAGALLAAFDVFVLSSRTEGTPIVLLEAMAAGVPIVATTVGGVPDVVTADDALLVPPDNPSAVAAAIQQVLASPHASEARAGSARRRVETGFAPRPWLEKYEQLYLAVAQRSRKETGVGRQG